MNVLIVEDEALIAIYLEALVVDFGHQVCAVAASAPEAIDLAARHAPDVALMDTRLEIYLCYRLRCIFVSGNLDDTPRRALGPCKPIDFIAKPILPVTLRRALQTAERLIER